MRWLINYIRQMLCKHDFEFIRETRIYSSESDSMPIKSHRIYRCKKCGYAQRVNL